MYYDHTHILLELLFKYLQKEKMKRTICFTAFRNIRLGLLLVFASKQLYKHLLHSKVDIVETWFCKSWTASWGEENRCLQTCYLTASKRKLISEKLSKYGQWVMNLLQIFSFWRQHSTLTYLLSYRITVAISLLQP